MAQQFTKMLEQGRKARGVTLRKLSQLVDLSPSFLSDMENGRRKPPKDEEKLKDIALVLGIDSQKFSEAARIERMKDGEHIFKRLFRNDQELAYGLCRAVEDSSDTDLQDAFKELIKSLNRKKGG